MPGCQHPCSSSSVIPVRSQSAGPSPFSTVLGVLNHFSFSWTQCTYDDKPNERSGYKPRGLHVEKARRIPGEIRRCRLGDTGFVCDCYAPPDDCQIIFPACRENPRPVVRLRTTANKCVKTHFHVTKKGPRASDRGKQGGGTRTVRAALAGEWGTGSGIRTAVRPRAGGCLQRAEPDQRRGGAGGAHS